MMRKMPYLLLFTMLCTLLSCEHSEAELDAKDVAAEATPMKTITVSAGIEQPSEATKTSLGDGNMVLWSKGDSFNVLSSAGTSQSSVSYTVTTNYSTYSSYSLSNCYDGNTSTYFWSAEAQASGKYILITFASPVLLNSFQTYSSKSTDVPNTCNELQVSQDGSQWETVGTFTSSATTTFSNINKTGVKYVRIMATSTITSWLYLNEITMSYSDSGSNSKFEMEDAAAGQTYGNFTGTIPESATDLYAVYPYSSSNSFDGTAVSFALPHTQQYVEGSFASGVNPSVGKLASTSGTYSVAFKNVCGILRLSLKGSETVTSLEVTDLASNNSLWGNASINISEIGTGYAAVSGGSNTIVLDCGNGVKLNSQTATPFYFVVPVGSFASGLQVKVTTTNGIATKTASVSNAIVRSYIKAMPTLNVDALEYTLPEFNIENDAVAEYIANSTATLSSTSGNYAQSFFDQTRDYRPDQPKTKTIEFSSSTASTATVLMSEHKDMSSPILNAEVTLTNGSGSYTLRNMVPGRTYYYKAVASDEVLTSGAFVATGQVRMIAVEKGFNIRDLGGWTGLDGNKVIYEKLYRGASIGGTDKSGTTSDITADDKAEFKRIGIGAQLDLRAATNSGKYSGESSYHSYSRGETTLLDADFNNTMTDYGAYNQDASVIADVAWIIYELKKGRPVYFNCRQGADRTGTIAFIIEGLLGCYGSDTGRQMGMDYELTGFSQANSVDNVSVSTSYRAATEAYGTTGKLFRQLLDLSATGYTFNNLHEKCYYYLNKYALTASFSQGSNNNIQAIDKSDLDWFINYMLGVVDVDGNLINGHTAKVSGPSWASSGADLKTVAESKNNVITYVD